jgi:hypothetical protein
VTPEENKKRYLEKYCNDERLAELDVIRKEKQLQAYQMYVEFIEDAFGDWAKDWEEKINANRRPD